jgi:hypothetical protein
MAKRPISITIIGWFLILVGISSAFMEIAIFDDFLSKEITLLNQIAMYLIGYIKIFLITVIPIIGGLGILKAKNWARILYVFWETIRLVIGLTIVPITTTSNLEITTFIVILFFLFRREANNYFNNSIH